jgi:hypothetical protein
MRRAAMHWNRGLSCLTIGAAACPSAGPLRLLVLVATCIAGIVLALPSAYHQTARADQTNRAQRTDWVEGTPGRDDGATRDFYNRAALLRWENFLGDWRDADDVAQGNRAYGTADITRDAVGRSVEWNVAPLVQVWLDGEHPPQGFFLRRVDGDGDFHFASREHDEAAERPRLVIETNRQTLTLSSVADTYLEPSTYRCQGHQSRLRVGGRNHALLRFDLSEIPKGTPIKQATLKLHVAAAFGSGRATIGVFRCAQGHDRSPSEPVLGLAARYPGDRGLKSDPDVVFFADFEPPQWDRGWTHVGERRVIDAVEDDPARKFTPLSGQALRVRIAEGANGALNTLYKFARETGEEPEEIYFRYYLRLADDWNQTIQGGKMPGISGTYGRAGWGGRKSDGANGWSARGSFSQTIPPGNPLAGLHPLGWYCYHADMSSRYGDIWLWQEDYRGYLENNRWYSIEQYIKLNTPGEKDGILRAWVDGRPAFEKTDIRFRHADALKIEQVWMNVYHGGTRPSPYDQHLYIDNVVIARKYIGPMQPLQE